MLKKLYVNKVLNILFEFNGKKKMFKFRVRLKNPQHLKVKKSNVLLRTVARGKEF